MLATQIHVLERLHDASHILRQAGRFLQIYRKLNSTKDLIEQAGLVHELEPLMADKKLEALNFLRDEIAIAVSTKQKLLSVAAIDLSNGLKNKKESKIENGLQILSNLDRTAEAVDEWLNTFLNDVRQGIKECFSGGDIASGGGGGQKAIGLTASGPSSTMKSGGMKGPGKLPTLTTSHNFRQKLWSSIEWLFNEEIFNVCQQVLLLQECLDKCRVDNTKISIKQKFWSDLNALLETSFSEAPPHIGQCLQQSLPKLLAATQGLQTKLGQTLVLDASTFRSLETGYLEKCGTTLKASLVGTDCPTQDAVDALVRAASIELSAAMVDEKLCLLVAGVFSAVSKDFFTKIEAYIKLGTADTQQVLDIPNAVQLQNTTLANTVFYHLSLSRRTLINLGTSFPKNAADKILVDLRDGERLIQAVLQQLIDSIEAALNTILLSMHREGLAATNIQSTGGPSLYMKEFSEFLQRAWSTHVVHLFNDTTIVEQCGRELAKSCVEAFVQNVAICRPVSGAGRARLRGDCHHLETALKPICKDLSALGRQFRMLRALSSLLTVTPEQIVEQTAEIGGPIQPYLVLFLLFGYATAPELSSPHTAAGWTNEKLMQWLQGHTGERERLELIAGAVQKYRAFVRQKNISQYDNVYPLISNYLESAFLYYK